MWKASNLAMTMTNDEAAALIICKIFRTDHGAIITDTSGRQRSCMHFSQLNNLSLGTDNIMSLALNVNTASSCEAQ